MIDKKYISTALIYAHALYGVAERHKILEQTLKEAELIINQVLSIKKFQTVLMSSNVGIYDKHIIITNALSPHFSKIIENVFHVVIDSNRINILKEIFYKFIELVDNKKGILYAEVFTTVEMRDEEKNRIQNLLEQYFGKRLLIEYILDPTLIGGVSFRCGDLLLDFSIKGDLQRIKEDLNRVDGLDNLNKWSSSL